MFPGVLCDLDDVGEGDGALIGLRNVPCRPEAGSDAEDFSIRSGNDDHIEVSDRDRAGVVQGTMGTRQIVERAFGIADPFHELRRASQQKCLPELGILRLLRNYEFSECLLSAGDVAGSGLLLGDRAENARAAADIHLREQFSRILIVLLASFYTTDRRERPLALLRILPGTLRTHRPAGVNRQQPGPR